ncbi:DUF1294 domain-containing protein [Akkermansiaceae bacterium]|nr:DUF1294 domain-containing protein [Akkermansiaceae bacterium]
MQGGTTKAKQDADRLSGIIAEWVEERGFGWVQHGDVRIFAHIREFKKGRVPVPGDGVSFVPGQDPLGRPCARCLLLDKEHDGPGLWACAQLAVLVSLPLLAGLKLPVAAWAVPLAMLVASVAAWRTYRSDKKAAEAGGWRFSETMLHTLELLGGWPGAFLAQRRYRHKTRKASYQAIFQSIVFLYQLAALDIVLSHRLWDHLVQTINESGILDMVP